MLASGYHTDHLGIHIGPLEPSLRGAAIVPSLPVAVNELRLRPSALPATETLHPVYRTWEIYAPNHSCHVLRNLSQRAGNLLCWHRAFLDWSIGREKRDRLGSGPG